jgi:hypothetical protein
MQAEGRISLSGYSFAQAAKLLVAPLADQGRMPERSSGLGCR